MYELKLVKKTVKRNQVTAIHLIAALIMIAMGLTIVVSPVFLNTGKPPEEHIQFGWIRPAGAILMVLGFAICLATVFFSKKSLRPKVNLTIRWIEILCFTFILAYCLWQQYYLPAAYSGAALLGIIVAYFLENASEKNARIIFNEDGVKMENKIKSSAWKWHQLEHFVVKHNVVTLQTLDKKLYQFIVEDNPYDSNEVNNYGKEKVIQAIPKRSKDDW